MPPQADPATPASIVSSPVAATTTTTTTSAHVNAPPPREADAGRVDPSAGGCNALDNDGPAVALRVVQGAAPAPRGGKIEDGVYRLKDLVEYVRSPSATPRAKTTKMKLVVSGARIEMVMLEDSGPAERGSFGFSTQGTVLTLAMDCPAPHERKKSAGYDASPGRLVLYEEGGESTRATEFTSR